MLRGAILGLGNVAVHGHLPAWRERHDVEIVAVSDARDERRAIGAEALPRARWHGSAESLLDETGLDFVDICTPPSSHVALIEGALRRGLHVLCEKPLVHSAGDLAGVADLADKAGRVLHTVHNWHHAPIVRRASELLRDGAIGAVRHAAWHTRRTRPALAADPGADNWRVDPAVAGGGVLTDHGWHVFYVLSRWIGSEPIAVSACLERRRHQALAVEDTATVQLLFAEATAEILLTWAADVRENWAEVRGTRGRLELRDDTLLWQDAAGHDVARWPCPPRLSDGSHHPDWFHPVADEFVAAIGSDDGARGNLAEASLCVALEAAARASSRQAGRLVSVAVSA